MFFLRQSGSSLVEVMVAALILAIGVTGMMSAQTQGLQNLRQLWWQWQAEMLAEDLDETLQARGDAPLSAAIMDDWRARVADALPAVDVEVRWPTAPDTPGEVRLQWQSNPLAETQQWVHPLWR